MFNILKYNFDQAYSGNRAPIPIYIHTVGLRPAGRLHPALAGWRSCSSQLRQRLRLPPALPVGLQTARAVPPALPAAVAGG